MSGPGRVPTADEYAAQLAELEHLTTNITLAQLRAMPEAELVRRYDALMAQTVMPWTLGPDDYLAELQRRGNERAGRRLEWLTWALVALTIVIAVATLALLLRGE